MLSSRRGFHRAEGSRGLLLVSSCFLFPSLGDLIGVHWQHVHLCGGRSTVAVWAFAACSDGALASMAECNIPEAGLDLWRQMLPRNPPQHRPPPPPPNIPHVFQPLGATGRAGRAGRAQDESWSAGQGRVSHVLVPLLGKNSHAKALNPLPPQQPPRPAKAGRQALIGEPLPLTLRSRRPEASKLGNYGLWAHRRQLSSMAGCNT